MTHPRPDRRVRRTKRRLKQALLELIEEREYDRITIAQITDRADVGRSTFYSHFDSKEELLFSGFDAWLRSLAAAEQAEAAGRKPPAGAARPSAPGRSRDGAGFAAGGTETAGAACFRFSLPLLRHVRTQTRFFEATIARGSNSRIRRRVVDLVAELVRIELARARPAEALAPGIVGRVRMGSGRAGPDADAEVRTDALSHAVAGAFLELVAWWLGAGRRLSAEAVDALFQQFAAGDATRPVRLLDA